jgi:exosortase F-associated protein
MLNRNNRIFIGVFSLAGLVLIFLFQHTDVASGLGVDSTIWKFIVNRSIRFILNDVLAILLIYALFVERKYVLFAVGVQVFGMVFVLIPYFLLKFQLPGYNGPLISFLHRLVLNPTLILLLIPAFYYQKKNSG